MILSNDYMKTIDLLLVSPYNNIGYIYLKLNQFQQSLIYFHKALELAHPSGVLTIHALIFAVYNNQNNPNHTFNYYKLNIKDHISQLDHDELVRLDFNIGINYYQLKNYNQALSDLKTDLELISSNQINSPSNQLKTEILTKIISILEKLDKWSQVNEYSMQMINYKSTPDIYIRIGIAYFKQGNSQDAVDHLKKEYQLAKTTGDIQNMTVIERYIDVFSRKIK